MQYREQTRPMIFIAWDGRTGFHGRRIDEIFLLFVWIHILQQGIWDMETRKLSRPRPRNSSISSSNRFLRRYCPFRAPSFFKRLELGERLDSLTSAGQNTQSVEADLENES